MGKIQVLDCTLRDGGYINNWEFGLQGICDIKKALEDTGIKFAELGFLRDEIYNAEKSVYDTTATLGNIIGNKKPGMIYGGLIEMANYYPPEKVPVRDGKGPDAIRYSFWKRLMDEAYDYCKIIKDKGYLLCCQPTRVEQYSDEEFAELCRRFSELEPYCVCVVDTFGLLHKDTMLRYAEIAHKNLTPGIILGYHAHDNMGQAFTNACAFLESDYGDRTIQVDASIFGMGRAAGNLRLEMVLEYLNYKHNMNYNLAPIYAIWEKHLKKIIKENPWGYDLAYFITAENSCNPNYASYYLKKGLSVSEIEKAIKRIEGPDKYLYSDDKAEKYAESARK